MVCMQAQQHQHQQMMMFNAGPGGPYMSRGDMPDMVMDGGMDKDGRRADPKDHRGMPPGGGSTYLRPSHYQVRTPPHPAAHAHAVLRRLRTLSVWCGSSRLSRMPDSRAVCL